MSLINTVYFPSISLIFSINCFIQTLTPICQDSLKLFYTHIKLFSCCFNIKSNPAISFSPPRARIARPYIVLLHLYIIFYPSISLPDIGFRFSILTNSTSSSKPSSVVLYLKYKSCCTLSESSKSKSDCVS